jgi:CTP synthase
MRPEDIISSPDASTVYEVPMQFHKQKLLEEICAKLSIPYQEPDLAKWEAMVSQVKAKKTKDITIAIVGKYFSTGEYQLRDSYAALMDAIDHASNAKNTHVNTLWIDSEKVERDGIEKHLNPNTINGVIVPIGWGERGSEGMIQAAGWARRNKIPYLGLCYGMQLAVVAFAREVLGWTDANTVENNKDTVHPVIHLMPAQKEFMERRAYGGTMRLGAWQAIVKKDTIAWEAYEKYNGFIDISKGLTSERHRHRYEFNDEFAKELEAKGLIISARSVVEHLVEIIELPKSEHPFYLGTQGHPEYKSRPLKPHPIFLEFVSAILNRI